MTGVLVLYADGQVRSADLDLDREDVLLATIDAPTSTTLDLDNLGIRLMFDAMGLGLARPINLGATLLLYGAGRRPMHPIVGDVIVVGLTTDDNATDVSDELLDLF